MKHIAIKVIDRLVLVAYGASDPSDEEWDGYLDVIEHHGVDRAMQIIVTDGGEPTSAQRRRLNELLAGRAVPVAVVSRSAVVRGTVTALSWFNRKIKAFPPSGLREGSDVGRHPGRERGRGRSLDPTPARRPRLGVGCRRSTG